jgi:hypothetical protein
LKIRRKLAFARGHIDTVDPPGEGIAEKGVYGAQVLVVPNRIQESDQLFAVQGFCIHRIQWVLLIRAGWKQEKQGQDEDDEFRH